MQVSKISFTGKIQNAKISDNTLKIDKVKYERGRFYGLDIDGEVKPIQLLDFDRVETTETGNPNIAIKYLDNGKKKTVLSELTEGSIYTRNELLGKVRELNTLHVAYNKTLSTIQDANYIQERKA